MKNGEASIFQLRCIRAGIARRGDHKPDALVDNELNDRRIANKRLSDVYAKWSVGEIGHYRDLTSDRRQVTR